MPIANIAAPAPPAIAQSRKRCVSSASTSPMRARRRIIAW
jgi:hypothetical protein